VTRIELKRRDGKPLYCFAEAVTFWTEAVEDIKCTEVSIGGQKWYLAQTVAEVDAIVREAMLQPA
jgi:hypothetical protein